MLVVKGKQFLDFGGAIENQVHPMNLKDLVRVYHDLTGWIDANDFVKSSFPVVVCRGFSSISFLNDFRNRLKHHEGGVVMLFLATLTPQV